MQLQQLFPQWQGQAVEITGLTTDSRKVQPGYLFLAVPGLRHDGRQHIDQAIAAGAAAIAYEARWFCGLGGAAGAADRASGHPAVGHCRTLPW